jgi:hypothetical protein
MPQLLGANFIRTLKNPPKVIFTRKGRVNLTVGANNVFDVYPDRLKSYENTLQGSWIYSPEASPFGFNGGYYFVAMSFNF